MKINTIINRYSDPTAGGKRGEAAEPGTIKPLQGFEPTFEPGDAKALSLRKILSQYDVTDITPREFSFMIHQMHKEGLISDDLFGQLSLVRGELDRAGIDADESVDLLAFHEKQLVELQLASILTLGQSDKTDEDEKPAATDRGVIEERLGWLRKLAVAQESPEMVGLNAVV